MQRHTMLQEQWIQYHLCTLQKLKIGHETGQSPCCGRKQRLHVRGDHQHTSCCCHCGGPSSTNPHFSFADWGHISRIALRTQQVIPHALHCTLKKGHRSTSMAACLSLSLGSTSIPPPPTQHHNHNPSAWNAHCSRCATLAGTHHAYIAHLDAGLDVRMCTQGRHIACMAPVQLIDEQHLYISPLIVIVTCSLPVVTHSLPISLAGVRQLWGWLGRRCVGRLWCRNPTPQLVGNEPRNYRVC